MLPKTRVRIFQRSCVHVKELALSFSPLFLFFKTVTMEPRTGVCQIYHVRKQTDYQKRHGGYRNWKLPRALTFSVREQHFIRLKSCAEYENASPNRHRATHYSAFDNVRLSTSHQHSDRNQNARARDNAAVQTRLQTDCDQVPSKTTCSCCNHSSTESQWAMPPAQIMLP